MSKINNLATSALTMLALLAATAQADDGDDRAVAAGPQVSGHDAGHAHATTSLATGTVRALDAKSGQVTITHGPLANLGMGAMTTPFKVRDRAMLS